MPGSPVWLCAQKPASVPLNVEALSMNDAPFEPPDVTMLELAVFDALIDGSVIWTWPLLSAPSLKLAVV
jgi:hypothetical protein